MAGLDTRGLADGFAQGFGMVNQYQQQERQNESADRRMDMQEQQFGLQMENAELKKEQLEQARDMEDLKFTLGKVSSGMDVDESEVELLRKYPKYWAALDPQTDASLEQAQMVIDPESPVDANDPESLDALNQMFGAEINKGEGGEKRITGMVPGPDGESVMLELEVTGENGETYRAPMTKGRSNDADADDMVMSIPVERLVEQTQGMRMLRNTFRSPEAQASATKVLNLLRGESPERWEQIEGPGGSILQRNTRTGEMKSVMGRAPQHGGRGGSYKPPSRIQEATELVKRGVYGTFSDAYEAVRARAGQGQQGGIQYINFLQDEMSAIDSQIEAASAVTSGVPEEEVKSLRSRRDELSQELSNASRQVFNRPASGERQQPQPERQQGDYPQVGDMVGNPGSSSGSSQPVQISNADEYGNLPSGSQYIDPDGNLRRKP